MTKHQLWSVRPWTEKEVHLGEQVEIEVPAEAMAAWSDRAKEAWAAGHGRYIVRAGPKTQRVFDWKGPEELVRAANKTQALAKAKKLWPDAEKHIARFNCVTRPPA